MPVVFSASAMDWTAPCCRCRNRQCANSAKVMASQRQFAPAVLDAVHRPADRAILVSLTHGTDGFGIWSPCRQEPSSTPEDGTRAAEEMAVATPAMLPGRWSPTAGHQGVEGGDVTGVITGDAALPQQGKAERDLIIDKNRRPIVKNSRREDRSAWECPIRFLPFR